MYFRILKYFTFFEIPPPMGISLAYVFHTLDGDKCLLLHFQHCFHLCNMCHNIKDESARFPTQTRYIFLFKNAIPTDISDPSH
jgi:hypothetical protein